MLILASASPTRRQLLENARLQVEVTPAQIDERGLEESFKTTREPTARLAENLAVAKAESVSKQQRDHWVIGADQTLSFGTETLHKPANMTDAANQLRHLRNATHELTSAVAIARNGHSVWTHTDQARLTMRDFSEDELQQVLMLEGEALLGSVGSYRLEGASIRLFERIEGDYFTILGLPLLPLLHALRTHTAAD